jgi:nicotinamidase/pyrazinamidase
MSVLHLGDLRIGPGDALVVVDVQRDFLPGGSLAVPRADEILAPLERAVARFSVERLPIFATRCWHPPDHCSFREQGGPWPVHCVRGTEGARFGMDLSAATVISKGSDRRRDAYSGFDHTDLAARLREAGAHHVFLGGLATEYCVFATASGALDHGFAVSLLVDGIRDIDEQAGARAVAELRTRGALVVEAGPHHLEHPVSP